MTPEHSSPSQPDLTDLLLELVPHDGSAIGNTALRRALQQRLQAQGAELEEDAYWSAHAALVQQNLRA